MALFWLSRGSSKLGAPVWIQSSGVKKTLSRDALFPKRRHSVAPNILPQAHFSPCRCGTQGNPVRLWWPLYVCSCAGRTAVTGLGVAANYLLGGEVSRPTDVRIAGDATGCPPQPRQADTRTQNTRTQNSANFREELTVACTRQLVSSRRNRVRQLTALVRRVYRRVWTGNYGRGGAGVCRYGMMRRVCRGRWCHGVIPR